MVTSVLPVRRVAPPLIDMAGGHGCRVRVWLNGSLGRPCDWAVLLTFPGHAGRQLLDDVATEVKHLVLRLASPDEIAWFYLANAAGAQSLNRITLSHRRLEGKDVYFGYCLDPVLLIDLELAAGGSVEL